MLINVLDIIIIIMKSARISLLTILLITIIIISGCVQETTAPKIYMDTLHGFGFSMISPSGWIRDYTKFEANTKLSNALLIFDSPVSPDSPSATIVVFIFNSSLSDLDTDISGKPYFDYLKENKSQYTILEKKSMTINGKKAYSLTYENDDDAYSRVSQHIFIERNDLNVFYLGFFTHSSKQFETYHDVFINTVNSFKIIEK